MNKLNAILLAILVLCAWSVVTSQHVSRQLYSNLEREQKSAQQLQVEYGQLLLEQSTWGAHALIEKTAALRLGMKTPEQRQVQVVTPSGGT
ncbi:cell division protein FtsL [Pseudogulbenkiania sp. NH8B]|uniref:cell division protein FtsL n=1 Tax=Pseudogulbenkiania sp. (strain NH8B) TaxID=748280 RepID=UPI0002279100|nr:cell division protein FtsL [Pseudogulbenkiania sp. NH8B]BAK75014.1 cell division protein FtsL [Pseudogulbenkiania sp. NH8B]